MSLPPLSLTPEQATRLVGYIQAYRRYALTQVAPSTERNANQRFLQALQGKLIHERGGTQQGAVYHLSLTNKDVTVLKTMVVDLLSFTRREPASRQRDATLLDLAALTATLERLSPSRLQGNSTCILL